jgi:hypothetical protein
MSFVDKVRVITRYSWIVVGLAVLFAVGVLVKHWREDRSVRERILEKKREEDRRVVEMLGGNRFEILNFYATPPGIKRGEPAQLCYGVSNAKSVRLEPQSAEVWPSFSRCVSVTPQKDTTFTLTIDDGAGHTKSATVSVKVF